MRCNICKTQNDSGANFCESCGAPIKKSNAAKSNKVVRNNRNKAKSQLSVLNYLMSHKQIWVFTSIFLTVLIVIVTINNSNSEFENPSGRFIEVASLNPIIEAGVFKIASNFVCGCGSCNEESLDICKCNYAIDERKFIRGYLENGNNESDVISAVINKYGGLKAETNNDNNEQKIIPLPHAGSKLIVETATISDRENIYSAFTCPCGQCGIDELKDCACNHKNGAQEVKKFIDQKILENQFSVTQIIDIVDDTYGGKK